MRGKTLLTISFMFATLAIFARAVAAAGGGDAGAGVPKLTGTLVSFCACERMCEQALSEPGKRAPCSHVIGLQIDAGQRGGVGLGGIAAALVVAGPAGGKGESPPTLYVDRSANEAQAEAIRAILNERFAGAMGAPLGPPRSVGVRVTKSSETISVAIDGVADLRGRPLIGNFHRPIQVANSGSVIAYPSIGRGTAGQVVDPASGVRFDAEGHCVLYGKFDFGGGKSRK
ncbi:MAG TPA: DUF1326 domain-containing protein [Planctomycetota bacterium]|nr:DUF1326 domain-containing protein [Planctomycetota bacterium]